MTLRAQATDACDCALLAAVGAMTDARTGAMTEALRKRMREGGVRPAALLEVRQAHTSFGLMQRARELAGARG